MSERERPIGHFVAGIVLIALGVLFLLDRAYVIRFARVFEVWWPSLLILWGVVNLVTSRCRRWTGALVLITLGVIFQGETLHLAYWWEMERLWPVVLIAIGIGILARRVIGRAPSEAPPSQIELKS
jgi:hypothetical protein